MTGPVSEKRLEALIARGAKRRPKPVPVAPPPAPQIASESPSANGADRIVAAVERLNAIVARNMLDNASGSKPSRLVINRDDFGMIETIDIERSPERSN